MKKRLIWETNARHQRHVPAVQPVRQAVRQDGVKAGVAKEDLEHAFGGRVFPEDGVDLFTDGAEHVALVSAGGRWVGHNRRLDACRQRGKHVLFAFDQR